MDFPSVSSGRPEPEQSRAGQSAGEFDRGLAAKGEALPLTPLCSWLPVADPAMTWSLESRAERLRASSAGDTGRRGDGAELRLRVSTLRF